MGTDIYSGSGVICEVDQAVRFINGKNKAAVIQLGIEFYGEIVAESEKSPEDQWRQETAKFFEPLAALAKTPKSKLSIKAVQDIFASVVKVSGKPAKYDIDTHVLHSEYVAELFQKIIASYSDVMGVEIPYLVEVQAWGSSRYNGWDVPKGVACFVFDKDHCFTQAVSDEGKALKKVIGHCDVTEWTEYSC
ncbi:MAG: hypothetical protein ACXABD_10355 [Candidatus Thorarchaeota archaeon]|jgi:hypothetical protein